MDKVMIKVTIVEVCSKDFMVAVKDLENAPKEIKEKYESGELVLDGDSEVSSVEALIHTNEDLSNTDWITIRTK